VPHDEAEDSGEEQGESESEKVGIFAKTLIARFL
jgi:hypothetical protein